MTNWIQKASRCPLAQGGFEPYHKWIPVAKKVSPTAEHVTMLMCGVCFKEVNVRDAFEFRSEQGFEDSEDEDETRL